MIIEHLETEQFIRVFKPDTDRERALFNRVEKLYNEVLDLQKDLEVEKDALEYLDDKNIALEKELERLKA